MANTTQLELPLLAAAQAQKHVTHNEAIQRLDAIVQLAVKDRHLTTPPGSPSDGDRYMPASGATGAWEDWDFNIAWYVDGVWTKLVPRGGWIAYVEDEALVLVHDGSGWVKLPAAAETWQVLAASAAAVSHTGNTAETTLATVTVPAGVMGPNGVLRSTTIWSVTNSANTKTCRTRFGGITGPQYGANVLASVSTHRDQREIHNRNAASSQLGFGVGGTGGWHVGGTTVTSSLNTAAAQDLVFTAELAVASETITLESYLVELLHQA